MMDAKEYLKQIARDNVVIENKLAEIRRLESLATNISSVMSDTPVQSSGNNDSVGKLVADIADKKAELQFVIDELNTDRDKRIKVIEQLEDRLQYSVIYKRYVDLMRFEDIADEKHYSTVWIFKIHKQALYNIQIILNSIVK